MNGEGHVLSLIFIFFVQMFFFTFLKSQFCAVVSLLFLNSTLVHIFFLFFWDSQFSAYARYSLSLVGTD